MFTGKAGQGHDLRFSETLDRHGITSLCRSYYLSFAEFLTSQPAPYQLSLDESDAISEMYHGVGLGDWIFGVPPFRSWDASRDQTYTQFLQHHGVPTEVRAGLHGLARPWNVEDGRAATFHVTLELVGNGVPGADRGGAGRR